MQKLTRCGRIAFVGVLGLFISTQLEAGQLGCGNPGIRTYVDDAIVYEIGFSIAGEEVVAMTECDGVTPSGWETTGADGGWTLGWNPTTCMTDGSPVFEMYCGFRMRVTDLDNFVFCVDVTYTFGAATCLYGVDDVAMPIHRGNFETGDFSGWSSVVQ